LSIYLCRVKDLELLILAENDIPLRGFGEAVSVDLESEIEIAEIFDVSFEDVAIQLNNLSDYALCTKASPDCTHYQAEEAYLRGRAMYWQWIYSPFYSPYHPVGSAYSLMEE